jgi:hypothetical protein
MPEVMTPREKVLAEHHRLRETLNKLRSFLQQPRPEQHATGAHAWGQALAERLLDLHGRLFCHFRTEQEGGLFDELRQRAPQSDHSVDQLEVEHGQMLKQLRELLFSALAYASNEELPDPGLRRRTGELMELLDHHEAEETRLIEDAYWQDLGRGA